jgi:hypothetical protein
MGSLSRLASRCPPNSISSFSDLAKYAPHTKANLFLYRSHVGCSGENLCVLRILRPIDWAVRKPQRVKICFQSERNDPFVNDTGREIHRRQSSKNVTSGFRYIWLRHKGKDDFF